MPVDPGRRRFMASRVCCAAVLWCLAMSPAYGLQRGTTATGINYTSGGASYEELDALRLERSRYSFWLTTATRGSGAYLAGVRVRIADEAGRRVLEHVLDGPWLLANLPLGRYEVEAILLDERTGRLEIQRGVTTIHPGDRHSMVLYFSVSDDLDARRDAGAPASQTGRSP